MVNDALRQVCLLNVPLELFHRSQSHHDELFREFALIASSRPHDQRNVPARLLRVIDEIRTRFSGFTDATQAEIESAVQRGDASIDVVFRVPPEIREASIEFDRLLDEADRFCSDGNLLTLSMPADELAFRRWYLTEFIEQLGGAPPRPWSDGLVAEVNETA